MSRARRAASPRRRTKREVTLKVSGDRRAAEALQLEIRRLAKRFGLSVASVRIRRAGRPST